MLKRRLIPVLKLRAGRDGRRPVLVTTVRFSKTIEVGDPVSQARVYQAQAADELIFLDLDRPDGGRGAFLDAVARAAAELFMPLTVGGNVRTLEDFRLLLANGADKVSVNGAALRDPRLVREASDRFGAQCVVVSIDMAREGERWRVATDGGTGRRDLDPAGWAAEAERLGAGEILLTSVDRDGTRQGLDLEGTRRVRERLTIPLIAAGGCGAASHFIEGFLEGGADAVAAGTYFCFKDENPMQTRSRIRNSGIPIRLHT